MRATENMKVTSRELLTDNLDADDLAGERARLAVGERIQQAKAAEFHSLELVLGIKIEDSPVIVRAPRPGEVLGGGVAGCSAAARVAGRGPVAVRRARRRLHAAATPRNRAMS